MAGNDFLSSVYCLPIPFNKTYWSCFATGITLLGIHFKNSHIISPTPSEIDRNSELRQAQVRPRIQTRAAQTECHWLNHLCHHHFPQSQPDQLFLITWNRTVHTFASSCLFPFIIYLSKMYQLFPNNVSRKMKKKTKRGWFKKPFIIINKDAPSKGPD